MLFITVLSIAELDHVVFAKKHERGPLYLSHALYHLLLKSHQVANHWKNTVKLLITRYNSDVKLLKQNINSVIFFLVFFFILISDTEYY